MTSTKQGDENPKTFTSTELPQLANEEGYRTEEDKSIIAKLCASGTITTETNLCFRCGNLIRENDHCCNNTK